MKLMSFNTQHCLNYLEQKIDFQIMADAIKAMDADIVGLNEMYQVGGTDPQLYRQTGVLSELTGLNYSFFAKALVLGEGRHYGNGLLSRYPIVKAEAIPVPDPNPHAYGGYYEPRCLLKAELEGGITVLVIHFGLNPDEAESAVNTVLANLADEKCILMGDFNVKPDDPVLAPIRVRMKDTADVFSAPLLSWPSDKPKSKIDYIFVSPDVEVVSADIPAIVASDHRPHTAEVTM